MDSDVHTGPLTTEIDQLNQQAWDIRVSDSRKALEIAKATVELSRKINYDKGVADALRIEGFGYIRMADYEKANACLEEASAIFHARNDIRGLSVVNEYFGIVQRYRGNGALALEHIFTALEYSRQTSFKDSEITNLYQIGVTYRQLANYEKALEYLYQSLSLARSTGFTLMEAYNLHVIGSIYFETGEFNKALQYFSKGLSIRQSSGDLWGEAGSLDNIGFTYLQLEDFEQAIHYCSKSLEISQLTGDKKGEANALQHLADAYKHLDDIEKASLLSHQSLLIRQATGDRRGEAEVLLFLCDLQNQESGDLAEMLYKTLDIAAKIEAPDLSSKLRFRLYEYYKRIGNFEKGIEQLELHIRLEREVHRNTIDQKVLNLEISYKAEQAQKEAEAVQQRNEELTKLNDEIKEQKSKLEQSLSELKSTQQQLIQSEKMASLGAVTAGIAHEIQNPLNFVNNFSEVNKELIDEMKQEIQKGNLEEAKIIADQIEMNEEKIGHHGKRADAIVKGMLRHSSASSGNKEPSDINALAEEYLRLSYYGMRAKNNSFCATLETDFDNSIGELNIIRQDIGRVLLNLYNNAFYAVAVMKKQQGENYEPFVSLSTKRYGDKIEIRVSDNGTGIPHAIVDKIFQPFFTTKPTGEGTGLGLSLSYDIIKSAGGVIKVETKEGEGAEFTIELPTV